MDDRSKKLKNYERIKKRLDTSMGASDELYLLLELVETLKKIEEKLPRPQGKFSGRSPYEPSRIR